MTKKRRILSVIMAVALVASMMFAMTANTYATTDEGTINVYVTVERTLLGNQDPILAPTKVTVPEGSTVMDVLNKLKTDISGFDFTSTGSVEEDTAYVKGFKVASHGSFDYTTDYEFLADYIAEIGEDATDMYFEYGTIPSASDLYLEAGDYNMLGGWIVTANDKIVWDDETTKENEAYPTASAVIRADNTVLRFEYSMALTKDCGYKGWSLLTMSDLEPGFYAAADKSALVRKMADCTNKTSAAYVNGMSVLKKMKATNAEVSSAVNMF